ncbi:MAG TPA: alpha/beta fold hydrolase [Chitinophagaceae bacterium]|jgi:hypothetical protein|nr:alpha/beta fold hydrolase [Chitinophagaceae bacterium]
MKLSQRLALGYIRAKFQALTSVSKKKAAQKAFELFCTPQSRNKKKLPKIFETGEKLAFVLNDNVVRGWRFNHPAERKVLICHGFESSVINFDRYIKPLVKKGYEVLAFDAPAHGRSGGKTITAPRYKDMILAIHKEYGPVRSFMAHSFGGLAVSLALEEIGHQSDYRLVLIAPATETTTAIDSFFRLLKLDPVLRPEFEKIIIRTGGVGPEWYSIRRAMGNIWAKTRWYQDEEDEVTPMQDVLKVKEENYPNIEFVFTTGLGHRRIYRDNKVTRSVIEFL